MMPEIPNTGGEHRFVAILRHNRIRKHQLQWLPLFKRFLLSMSPPGRETTMQQNRQTDSYFDDWAQDLCEAFQELSSLQQEPVKPRPPLPFAHGRGGLCHQRFRNGPKTSHPPESGKLLA